MGKKKSGKAGKTKFRNPHFDQDGTDGVSPRLQLRSPAADHGARERDAPRPCGAPRFCVRCRWLLSLVSRLLNSAWLQGVTFTNPALAGDTSSSDEDNATDVKFSNPIRNPMFAESDDFADDPQGEAGVVVARAATPRRECAATDSASASSSASTGFWSSDELSLAGTSLCVLGPESRLRQAVFRVVHSPPFEGLVVACILAQTVCLILEIPGERLLNAGALKWADIAFTLVFTLELALRVAALGFIVSPHAYLRHKWNMLDFIIIAATWASYAIDELSPTGGSEHLRPSVLRAVRALRPLRALRFFESMQAVLDFLPYIMHVGVFMVFFFCVFGAARSSPAKPSPRLVLS